MAKARRTLIDVSNGPLAKLQKDVEKIAPKKYDICTSIDVVNGKDTGKKEQHLILVRKPHYFSI